MRRQREQGASMGALTLRRDVLDRLESNVRGAILAAAIFVALLACWQAVVVLTDVPSVVLPSPLAVAIALVELRGVLLADAAVTGATAAIGLTAGAAVGATLAFLMVVSRPASAIILPYVVALRIAPLIAIAPLLFLWFGRGIPGKALLVTTLTVFPITIATLDGLRSTPESYLSLLESVGASEAAVFLHVRLPAAAPSVFAGLKIAATLSVIGAVVAEFVTLDSGLGVRVFEASNALQTAESFAALFALTVLGLVFYGVPTLLERAIWRCFA